MVSALVTEMGVAGGGLTNTSVNWSPSSVPGANDDTRFFQTVTYTVTTASPADTFATVWASSTGHPQFSCTDPMRVRNSFQVDGATAASIISGTVHAGWFTVGPGSFTITGNGTQAVATNPSAYSYFGTASGFTSTVNINGGAAFIGGTVEVPEYTNTTGIINVSGHPTPGPPSTLYTRFTSGQSGYLKVGVQGLGDVELSNGAYLSTDGELWLGSNGVGKLHTFRNGGAFNTAPSMDVHGRTLIGGNQSTGSPGGQGTLVMDQGVVTFHQAILMGDDDGGSPDTLRMNGGFALAMEGLYQNASRTSILDLHGGSLRVDGWDNLNGSPYSFIQLVQAVPFAMSGGGAGPTLTLYGGGGHTINTTTPVSLVVGRNGGATLRVIGFEYDYPGVLTTNGGAILADSLTGTGTMVADTAGDVSIGGSLTVGPGNGAVQVRRESYVGAAGRTDVLASATTAGSILISDSLSEGIFYGLDVGGTGSAATPGAAIVQVDSGAVLRVSMLPLQIRGGGGKLMVSHRALAYVDSVLCRGVLQLADAEIDESTTLHVLNGGSVHGVGTLKGRVSLDDATATLSILASDPPNKTLTVGDSTAATFVSHGTVRVEQDTLVLLNHGVADLGHVVLAGGTLRLPNAGHVRNGDVVQGTGRLEGTVTDDGAINASGTLDLVNHVTCLTGDVAGSGVTIDPGGELSARGTLTGGLDCRGQLDMGPSLAKLTLQIAPTLEPGNALTMRVGSKSAGAQDTLEVGQGLTLGGTLDLRSWSPNPPVVGDTLTLITAPSISGTFAAVTIDGILAPSFVQAIYTPTSVKVAILRPLSGVPVVTPGTPSATGVTALRFAAAGTLRAPAFALDLPAAADVRVAVYDVSGRQVALLRQGAMAAGPHRLPLSGDAFVPGVYFGRAWVREAAGEHLLSARAVRLR